MWPECRIFLHGSFMFPLNSAVCQEMVYPEYHYPYEEKQLGVMKSHTKLPYLALLPLVFPVSFSAIFTLDI